MIHFPSLRGLQTSLWLNVEQSGGQERGPKQHLRRALRAKRKSLHHNATLNGEPWGQAQFQQLIRLLGQLPSQQAPNDPFWLRPWAAFMPIGSELNLLEHCPMDSCWLPHALDNGSMQWFRWQAGIENWTRDTRSLPVPPPQISLNDNLPLDQGLTVVLTPCLAVDSSGTRLGYGGGYYDRLLALHGQNILSVACVPSELHLPPGALPREAHDMPVDVVVSEHGALIIAPKKLERCLYTCK